jgi:TolB protein
VEVAGASCPDPLNPDSDGDGIIDGLDLDPCDPNNPSLTATAAAGQPATPVPTEPPSVGPTATPEAPAPTPTGGPPPPALPGLISFASNREGSLQIYASIDPTGAVVTRLTPGGGEFIDPAWSPDRQQIAFASNMEGNNEIYVADADGGNLRRLTNDPADDLDPTWSPDGNWIAFTSSRDGNQEIYVMRSSDGLELQNLTANPAADTHPSWMLPEQGLLSNDAGIILFATDRDGNLEVYRMEADGSAPTNLTNDPGNDHFPAGLSAGNGVSNDPARRILFTSYRAGNADIYVMDLDGGNQVNLTNDSGADYAPTWSPDGEWIAFTSDRTGNLEIFVLPAAGGTPLNLTNNAAEDHSPSWR